MKAVTRIDASLPSSVDDQTLMAVLRDSIYPGAKDESIRMVLSYCKAARLDPLQKPVHIVPMQVATGKKDDQGYDIKVWRDVVMPGIGLYRTQASRTNQYSGISKPEYGEKITGKLGGVDVTYPEWCSITVKKMVAGQEREFSACEYWTENYATKGRSSAPNSMWSRRPYAQIAKCAEAQALRKAFPDSVGAAPTADEMEGRPDFDVVDHDTGEILAGKPQVSLPQSKSEQTQSHAEMQIPPVEVQKEMAEQPINTAPPEERKPVTIEHNADMGVVTAGEKAYLKNKAVALNQPIESAMKACGLTGTLDTITKDGFNALKDHFSELSRG